MCEFIAILVYEGLIEDVKTFDDKIEAITWITTNANECGVERCSDSVIWDMNEKRSIELNLHINGQSL